MTSSHWYKDAIFYQVYIRAFADGNGDGHGDFRGLTSRLDYLKELGVTCLWLMPMYPSPLVDDGYDIADYYGIHPDYGTLDDFKTFLAAAHERGLRVIADLVLNHTSDQHPWFQSARASRASPYRDFFVWSDTDQKFKDARIIFTDTEKSNWTWDEQAGQYFWHRFYSSQPDLNFDSPAVQDEMIKVVRFWLDMGLDGFRADAVPYLFEREGTSGENLPETHEYLKRLRREIDAHYPGRVLLAEANQWPADLRPYFGDGDEFQMCFHFPVMPRLYMALRRQDRSAVVEILEQTPPIPDNCQWCTFLRNHDELTLEMVTPEERQWMWEQYAPDPRMRINMGIRRRLAPLLDGDQRKVILLYSLLFTLPGAPIVYYGDEIGMGDNIWLHDRNGVRTPMQWTDGPNAGFSETAGDLYAPLIDDERYSFKQVNVAAARQDPRSFWSTLKGLIALRKTLPVLGGSDCRFLAPADKAILAFVRTDQTSALLAAHNLSPERRRASLDLPGRSTAGAVDLLTGRSMPVDTSGRMEVDLAPYGSLWLKLG